jgi:hypothetical protein
LKRYLNANTEIKKQVLPTATGFSWLTPFKMIW